jgi:hypothetical protein
MATDLNQQVRPFPSNLVMSRRKKEGTFIAQFVRDPWERLASLWRYFGASDSPRFLRVHGPSKDSIYKRWGLPTPGNFNFAQFVDALRQKGEHDEHTALVYPQHRDEHGNRIPEFHWPFERIDEGWPLIREVVPGLPESLPRSNATAKTPPHWTHYFNNDPVLIRAAGEWLEPDILFHEEVTRHAQHIRKSI